MNVNDFGHVSIVSEYDMMCARVYRVKCFNFSNIRIRIRIRTDVYVKIRIRRMRILINSVTSLEISRDTRSRRQRASDDGVSDEG